MTRILFLITMTLLTLNWKSFGSNIKPITRQKNTTLISTILTKDSVLEIKVKLLSKLDTIKLPGYCGGFMFRLTLKYEVINVLSGQYTGNTILINHICPREMIEKKLIENGKTYTYKVKRRLITKSIEVGQKIKMVDAGDYELLN